MGETMKKGMKRSLVQYYGVSQSQVITDAWDAAQWRVSQLLNISGFGPYRTGQVWRHTPDQRVAASTLRRYSFVLRLTIAQADARPDMSVSFR